MTSDRNRPRADRQATARDRRAIRRATIARKCEFLTRGLS